MSAVLTTTTSLSYSVPTLQTYILDVILTIMMLPCPAVSTQCIMYHPSCFVTDTTRIWNSNPYSGMIRLQGGSYSNQGRVEVYCNGQWGTICDDGFSSTDANTICKQLGYTGYIRYDHLTL